MRRSVPLFLFAAALAVALPLSDADAAGDDICAVLEESARMANSEAPLMVDDFTREEETVLSCADKTMDTRQTIVVSAAALPENWKQGKQEALNAFYCDDPDAADAMDEGWTFSQTVKLPDGSSETFKAACE